MNATVVFLGIVIAAGVSAVPAAAQQRAPLSVEASVGTSYGYGGGDRMNREGYALDGLVAWRARPLWRGALLLGASAGRHGSMGADAVCSLTPTGECRPGYPRFTGGSLLAGWEAARARSASLRVLVGPSVQRAEAGGGALAVQARVELATPPLARLALVGSARGSYLPAYRGEAYLLQALGIGLRLQ